MTEEKPKKKKAAAKKKTTKPRPKRAKKHELKITLTEKEYELVQLMYKASHRFSPFNPQEFALELIYDKALFLGLLKDEFVSSYQHVVQGILALSNRLATFVGTVNDEIHPKESANTEAALADLSKIDVDVVLAGIHSNNA